MTTRRELLIELGVIAFAWTGAARAQSPARVARIGLLSQYSPSYTVPLHEAFRQGLRELGWVEGKNISIEYRYSVGRSDRLADLADDLVRLRVDVIVASTASAALAAQKASKAIPVVFAAASDPVASGLVVSLARPGGNVTGLTQIASETAGKLLELLKEIIPKLSRVAVLWNPQSVTSPVIWKELQLPAQRLGLQLHALEVRSPDDFDQAFEEATRVRAGALFLVSNPVITTNLRRIADLAAKTRLPSVFGNPEFADAGGLMSYGGNSADAYRRTATFVDKILKGAKPSDLPVDRAIRWELVINLRTARALGLTIPQSVLVRADRVIE